MTKEEIAKIDNMTHAERVAAMRKQIRDWREEDIKQYRNDCDAESMFRQDAKDGLRIVTMISKGASAADVRAELMHMDTSPREVYWSLLEKYKCF